MSVLVEVLPVGRYEAWEVRHFVAKKLRKRFPPRTFRYWKEKLGVVPDEDGFYWDEDVDKLKAAAIYIRKGGQSFRKFNIMYSQEGKDAIKE